METIAYQTPKQCRERINRANSPAPLSRQRLIVTDVRGEPHIFNLYTYEPMMWETLPRHLFTACGRFTVYPVKSVVNGQKITLPGQFVVCYRGEPVPDERFAMRDTIRAKQYRPKAAYKQTRGVLPA